MFPTQLQLGYEKTAAVRLRLDLRGQLWYWSGGLPDYQGWTRAAREPRTVRRHLELGNPASSSSVPGPSCVGVKRHQAGAGARRAVGRLAVRCRDRVIEHDFARAAQEGLRRHR